MNEFPLFLITPWIYDIYFHMPLVLLPLILNEDSTSHGQMDGQPWLISSSSYFHCSSAYMDATNHPGEQTLTYWRFKNHSLTIKMWKSQYLSKCLDAKAQLDRIILTDCRVHGFFLQHLCQNSQLNLLYLSIQLVQLINLKLRICPTRPRRAWATYKYKNIAGQSSIKDGVGQMKKIKI